MKLSRILLLLSVIINTDVSAHNVLQQYQQSSSNSSLSQDSKIYKWRIIRVVDGDTFEIANDFLPQELKLFIRISGIDTPEKAPRSKCLSESILAQKASIFTKNKIQNAQKNNYQITFQEIKWDKYGGRILARVKINDSDLGEELINKGLARRYNGGKKLSWCEN